MKVKEACCLKTSEIAATHFKTRSLTRPFTAARAMLPTHTLYMLKTFKYEKRWLTLSKFKSKHQTTILCLSHSVCLCCIPPTLSKSASGVSTRTSYKVKVQLQNIFYPTISCTCAHLNTLNVFCVFVPLPLTKRLLDYVICIPKHPHILNRN